MSTPINPEGATPVPPRRHWDPVTLSTAVIALATVGNVVFSGLLYKATRQAFESASTPYVGTQSLSAHLDKERRIMDVVAVVKNFGTAPAVDCVIRWEITLNGAAHAGTMVPDRPKVVLPGTVQLLHGALGASEFDRIASGESTLVVVIRASYKGPTGKSYSFSSKHQYDPSINAFLDLGPEP